MPRPGNIATLRAAAARPVLKMLWEIGPNAGPACRIYLKCSVMAVEDERETINPSKRCSYDVTDFVICGGDCVVNCSFSQSTI